jgi:hypothetical protein
LQIVAFVPIDYCDLVCQRGTRAAVGDWITYSSHHNCCWYYEMKPRKDADVPWIQQGATWVYPYATLPKKM